MAWGSNPAPGNGLRTATVAVATAEAAIPTIELARDTNKPVNTKDNDQQATNWWPINKKGRSTRGANEKDRAPTAGEPDGDNTTRAKVPNQRLGGKG